MTKVCRGCSEDKPLSEFKDRGGKQKGQPKTRCTSCVKGYMAEYRKRNRISIRANANGAYKEIRDWYIELKSRPCVDCNNTYPWYVMDFDHRDRSKKRAAVSKLLTSSSKAVIMLEAAKCDLVCSNCHRIRTWGNAQSI